MGCDHFNKGKHQTITIQDPKIAKRGELGLKRQSSLFSAE
jgi:hypothetical protein